MPANNFNINRLTDEQVLDARKNHGDNRLAYKKKVGFLLPSKDLQKSQ